MDTDLGIHLTWTYTSVFTKWLNSYFKIKTPTGKIETKEQYDYVMYYGNHTPIDVGERYMKSYEESKGKYLHLGSWFGGASFYYYCSDEPEHIDGYFEKDAPVYEKFSYGKFGKIEFE